MSAYGELHNWILAAAAVVIAVRARDFMLNIFPCQMCGQHGNHRADCPGNNARKR